MTRLHRYRARLPFWAIADAPVWYRVRDGRVPAVIDGNPWFAIGKVAWMAKLRDVRIPFTSDALAIKSVEVGELSPRREEPAS